MSQTKDKGDIGDLPPKFCMHCGAPVADSKASFCMICGESLQSSQPTLFSPSAGGSNISREEPKVPANLDEIKYPTGISLVMPVVAFLFIAIIVVIIVFIILLTNPSLTLDFIETPEFLIAGLFLELFFIVPPFVYLRQYFPRKSTKLRLQLLGLPLDVETRKKILPEVLIGLSVGFGLVFLVTGLQMFSEWLWSALFGPDFVAYGVNSFYNGSIENLTLNTLQLVLIWVAMFGAVGPSEEILYRGFTQRGLIQSWGKSAGILVTALLFTFAHIIPWIRPLETIIVFFLPYFAISLLLGFMREWRKGNLLANIIAHGFYNSLIITLAVLGF